MSKERLTYRNCIEGEAYLKYGLAAKWEKMPRYDILNNAIQKLAEYEDLEEQGLLLRLPCQIGNMVYVIVESYSYGEVGDKAEKWYSIHNNKFDLNMLKDFGKTIFLTQSEAEEKLRKLEKDR